MIEQEKGLLYLVKLNKTSFEQNPGRVELPRGKYVIEIREGVFFYKNGFMANVEVSYINGGKRKTRLPSFGYYKKKENAENIYQGVSVEIDHDGGEVEIYNPRPASKFFKKTDGMCVVGIWDGKMFGAPSGQFEAQEYKPSGTKNILVLTNNPALKPYAEIGKNVVWQSDLKDYGKYDVIIATPESHSFLYKLRDNKCLDSYIKSGGNVYLTGSSLRHLSYYNTLPFELPWYIGGGAFNVVAAIDGDTVSVDSIDAMALVSSITIPVVSGGNGGQDLANLHSSDRNIGTEWCMAKRIDHGPGKVAWSSFFLLDYQHTEIWNNLVKEQIDWLLE